MRGTTRRFLAAHGELLLVFGLGALAQVEIWLDAMWQATGESSPSSRLR